MLKMEGSEHPLAPLKIVDVARLVEELSGVRQTARDGLAEWRYHGRLVARQLDDAHLVIRADFDYRDSILRQFPGTFSVPRRFVKHMMVVADVMTGDAGAIEEALEAAWQLQRSAELSGQSPRHHVLCGILGPTDTDLSDHLLQHQAPPDKPVDCRDAFLRIG